jgi:Tol biopolymer transport system component
LAAVSVNSQSVNTEFGKNRVQYHDDFTDWWRYETQNFIIYWYGKGRNIAQATIQLAEYDFTDIQSLVEHRINDKIEILVYLDITDLKQSNLGSEDTFVSETGQTKIVGNKIFTYFDGNHKNLRKQIREGIAQVYLNSMFFGNTLQEIVQNAVLLSIPEWYKDGIVAYIGSPWNHEIEDEFRDIFLRENEKFKKFNKLSDLHPRVAGHSLWYYMDQNYGKATISNLLYLTRINRNIESAFLYVLGTSYENIIDEWYQYYTQYYDREKNVFDERNEDNQLDIKNKKYRPISKLRFSPDGETLMYVVNQLGKSDVRLKNIETGEDESIFKTGFVNTLQETDYNYPHVAWSPNGQEITIMYEYRDIIRIRKYHVPTGDVFEQDMPENMQRVYSLSYYDDENYIFAANTDGYSDLYQYLFVKREVKRITNDFYDDLDAEYCTIGSTPGILFSSNRNSIQVKNQKLDTVLPIDNFDLFFYPFEENPDELIRITNTPYEDERQAFLANGQYIAYLSDLSGVINRKLIDFTTDKKYFNSNKRRNIIFHHSTQKSDKHVYTYYEDGEYRVYLETPDWTKVVNPFITHYRKSIKSAASNSSIGVLDIINQPSPVPGAESPPIDEEPKIIEPEIKEGYLFQSEFPDPEILEDISSEEKPLESTKDIITEPIDLFGERVDEVQEKSDEGVVEFFPARAIASRLTFKLDYFTTKLDNEVLFEGLESFSGVNAELENPPVGILLKANTKDLFEDYVIEGGIRIPTTFNGTEYFLIFDDKKKHIDKRFAVYRKAMSQRIDPFVFPSDKVKRIIHLGMVQLKYPFDVYRSLRATTTLRFDKFFYQSSDNASFNRPTVNEQRLGLKLEYVFDNSYDIGVNIKHGTRYKFYIEAINRFNLKLKDGFDFELSKGFTTLIGMDVRHYEPIGRNAVWASRFSAATSVGSEKILFYLGGTDNWVFPTFDSETPLDVNENFSYKTLAPNLRGFNYNIRNGSSFAVLNTEVRFPVFKMLFRKRIKSSFFRNFQVIGFLDAGTAWYGLNPFSNNTPLNTLILENPPTVFLEVNFFRDPLVVGYGLGLRTTLLGYFIRFDYGWGIETRVQQEPKLYFSIGTDF